jgi:hypothetical protein
MDNEEFYEKEKEKIVLSDRVQKKILGFFLKTSIPRKIKQDRMKKALPSKEGQK